MGFLDCFLGIIPARAGFTKGYFRYGKARWDHPRSRGVYSGFSTRSCNRSGSSPLARGLPRRRRLDRHGCRIIPARAGFTPGRCLPGFRGRDHPRSRGVYHGRQVCWGHVGGSSPLARGLPGPRDLPRGPAGIIPARAGFTATATRTGTTRQDHPRSRGVYRTHCRGPIPRTGSSPLARGLQFFRTELLNPRGIIPARAGFTRVSG